MVIRPEIPQFVSADTPKKLRRKMLMALGKYKMSSIDFKVLVGPDGNWYAWFSIPLKTEAAEILKEGDD